MKTHKYIRTLLVIALAFTFAFANPFAMEKASAGSVIVDQQIKSEKILSKISEQMVINKGFNITSEGMTYNVDVNVGVTEDSVVKDFDFIIEVEEQNTKTMIEPISPGHWEVSQPGYYIIEIRTPKMENLPTSPIPRVYIEGQVKVETQGLPKYDFFKVETQGADSDKNTYDIAAGAANYQASRDLGRLFYIKDHYTGEFQRFGELTSVATEANRVGTTGDRGKTYTVYVVNRDVAEANKTEVPIPIGSGSSSWFTLTADQEAKLEGISQFETFSTPYPEAGKIAKISNKKGVTVATLTWTAATKADGSVPNISKYVIKRYNTAGKCLKTTTVTNLKQDNGDYKLKFTQDFYTPYKGKSVYKITPYYKYLDKEIQGTTKSITVTSKELSTGTDGNVVKVTNNKSGVLVMPEYGADGIGVFEKKGNKWVMVGKKKAVKASKGFTYFYIEKKNIGKKNLKFKSYVTDGGKTYWSPLSKKTFKQRKNSVSIGTPDNVTSYPWLEVTKVRTKIWYEGNNLKIKYRVVNRDGRQKINVQTTLLVENPLTGKFTTVGKSNKKSVTLSYGQQKFVTVTIKNAKKVDLHNNIIR